MVFLYGSALGITARNGVDNNADWLNIMHGHKFFEIAASDYLSNCDIMRFDLDKVWLEDSQVLPFEERK